MREYIVNGSAVLSGLCTCMLIVGLIREANGFGQLFDYYYAVFLGLGVGMLILNNLLAGPESDDSEDEI